MASGGHLRIVGGEEREQLGYARRRRCFDVKCGNDALDRRDCSQINSDDIVVPSGASRGYEFNYGLEGKTGV